jgi:protein TonB
MAALLSLGLHGLLLSVDIDPFGKPGDVAPKPGRVTIGLSYHPPATSKPPAPSVIRKEKKSRQPKRLSPPPAEPKPQAPAPRDKPKPAKKKPTAPTRPETTEPPKSQPPRRPSSGKKTPPRVEDTREIPSPVPPRQLESDAASDFIDRPAQPTQTATATDADKPEEAAGVPEPFVEAKPLYRRNPPPQYPRLARRRGYEGQVILEVLVGRSGRVEKLKVFQSSGYETLDQAALASVRTWRFQPARRGPDPVEMWVRVPVRFQIH